MDDRHDRPKTFPFTLLVVDKTIKPHGRFHYALQQGLQIITA